MSKSFDCILHSIIVYNKVNKSDVDESTPDTSLQHLELNVELEMSGCTRQLPLEVKFQGMREENTSFKFSVRMSRPTIGIQSLYNCKSYSNKPCYDSN